MNKGKVLLVLENLVREIDAIREEHKDGRNVMSLLNSLAVKVEKTIKHIEVT